MEHPPKLSENISFEIGTYISFLKQFFIKVFGLCMGITTDFIDMSLGDQPYIMSAYFLDVLINTSNAKPQQARDRI